MRVVASKALRVGLGDEVTIWAALPKGSSLGRLFVFAREGESEFSPYVQNVAAMLAVETKPQMMTPMMFRLNNLRSEREIHFKSDIDGWFCVMQEVDTLDDPRVRVHLKRRVNPALGWREWFARKFDRTSLWPMHSS